MLLAASAAPPPQDENKYPSAAGPPDAQQSRSSPTGQDEDQDEDEGKPQPNTAVVITARRLDTARTQIDAGLGSTVYSLNNDTIDDRPGGETGSIANILMQSPGVTVSGEAVTIRGSKDIQVRVNNVIIPEAISDPADRLSARLAQSTRVMTGTLPAQFGFVPAGVISLTTKNGLYNHFGELEFYGGTDGFVEPAMEWAGSAFNTSLFGSASLEADRMDVADLDGNETRDHRREIGGMAFADHILGSNDRLSFIIGGDDEHHRFGQTGLPAGTQESRAAYGVATYQHSGDNLTVQASLFAGSGTDEANFAERTREQRTNSGTQIDASYNLGTAHVIKAGLLASRFKADEQSPGGVAFIDARNSIGVYAQDEWKLSSTVTFNPGVRVDWLRGPGDKASIEPRASLVWTLPSGLTAHLGYARYATAAPVGGTRGIAGLPDERDDYFAGGVQYRVGVLTLGVDAYVRKAQDFLDEHRSIGSAVAQSFTFRAARFRGLELSATYATHPLSAWLNVSLSKARGRSIIDDSEIFAPATIAAAAFKWVPLSSDRPVTASGGVTWRSRRLALSAIALASSGAVRSPTLADPNGAREGAFATIGLSAVYHAGAANRRRDFRIDVTNVTNVRYLTNQATNLEGGWGRWARGQAITFGFEQGF